MKLLTGNSNKNLSQKISKNLKTKLVHSSIRKFSDGEIYIEINENIRGNSIFLIQSTSAPALVIKFETNFADIDVLGATLRSWRA